MKITKLECAHEKYGTWSFEVGKKGVTYVGGKPLPSEGEAHQFQTVVIPALEEALARIYNDAFHLQPL